MIEGAFAVRYSSYDPLSGDTTISFGDRISLDKRKLKLIRRSEIAVVKLIRVGDLIYGENGNKIYGPFEWIE